MKRVKVLLLAFMLLCTLGVVNATQVTEVNVTFDELKARPNPGYTLTDYSRALRNPEVGNLGPLYKGNAVNGYYFKNDSNNNLLYWNNGRWESATQLGWNEQLLDVYDYALNLECYIDIDAGYTVDTEHLQDIKVTVNGKEWPGIVVGPWNDYWGFFYLTIPIETDYTPMLYEVKLLNDYQNVSLGTSKQLSWELHGAYGTNSDKLSFEVIGNNSANTTITSNGLLQVSPSETAKTLKVRATSVVSPNVYHEITLNVLGEPLTYDKFEIDPEETNGYTGTTKKFKAVISGTAPKEYEWSVVNANDEETKIDSNGTLTIGSNESSENLTVILTSTWDPSVQARARVILSEKKQLTRLDLSVDFSKIRLSSEDQYKTLNSYLVKPEYGGLKSNTEGFSIRQYDWTNNGFWIYTDGTYESATRYWEEQVDPTKQMAIRFEVYVDKSNGFYVDINHLNDIELYLNGKKVSNYGDIYWNDYWGFIDVTIECDMNAFKSTVKKGDLNKDGVVNSTDAALALQLYAESSATTEDIAIADLNSDGKINSSDATMILEMYANNK